MMRTLGASDLAISRLGFGSLATSGGDWEFSSGAQDDADSIDAIAYAVGHGVNWIDTSPLYGWGHAEQVVGRAIAGLAEPPLVFTKCGRIQNPHDPAGTPITDLRPAAIRAECEASLRRLGVEAIDLYQFHWLDDTTGTPLEESWAVMGELQDAGNVRALGVCNATAAELERLEAVRHVDCVQAPLSAIRREAAGELLDWCARHGTSMLAYSPMCSGLLTDAFDRARACTLAATDWRRRNPDFRSPRLERNLALRDALAAVARARGVATGAVAIAWVLAWTAVSGAIVGARSAAQVRDWLAAFSLQLEPGELDGIGAAIEHLHSGAGPARPA